MSCATLSAIAPSPYQMINSGQTNRTHLPQRSPAIANTAMKCPEVG